MDHYSALGVAPDADGPTIRKAYLSLARRHHPDGHVAEGPAAVERAERRMQEVNAAWAVLGQPAARRRYDEERHGGTLPSATARTTAPGQSGWRPRADDTGWMDDFEAWRHEEDHLVPPEVPRTPFQQVVTVAPVAVFAGSLLVGFVGLATDAPTVVVAAFFGVIFSCVLLMGLLLLELRGRTRR